MLLHVPVLLFLFLMSSIPFINIPSFVYSSPFDGHLGYFQAIMSKGAVNIHVQVYVHFAFHFSWVKIQEWNF